MAEHAIPRYAVGTHDFSLRLLIASRDAARVALGCLHLGPPLLEWVFCCLGRCALSCPALTSAVRRHCSSIGSKLAFSPAYHVTTE